MLLETAYDTFKTAILKFTWSCQNWLKIFPSVVGQLLVNWRYRQLTALRRTLASFSKSASCHQQGLAGSKTLLQQTPPLLKLEYQLTNNFDRYNGCKTAIVYSHQSIQKHIITSLLWVKVSVSCRFTELTDFHTCKKTLNISVCVFIYFMLQRCWVCWSHTGFPLTWKPGELLEFYDRRGIFGMISRFTLVLTL